ncbi:SPARC-related modular calcium-binding protein 1 isoform X2 [Sitophilus oryzae]|uniref:SPARC-related modular calcium-binding protein 1 isoform X2 n=1 Tax=Sitophilus oryzae TaxID=7048 RepID=A0A6J2Y2A2_SITOR|nr:SPARC-related modular calcium-binding protein 1 isoform X2 [Sitophilus oryzae]
MWPSSKPIALLVGCCVLPVLFVPSAFGDNAQESSECNPNACKKTDNEKTVCGSDGLSYPNRCQLERVRCQNKNITMVKRGLCKQQRQCLEWDLLDSEFPQHRFKARCKQNGAYEPGQCHPTTGFCWCVTPDGIPIPYSTKKMNEKPGSKPIRCRSRKKKTRSPSNTKKNICRMSEKSLFNNNLIKSFHSEYHRDAGRNDNDDMVIKWKFRTLDQNNDMILDKNEYRDIKRLVKKAMKPKKCAKAFPKSCDINNDLRITSQEWNDCFDKNGQTDATVSSSNDADDEDADSDDFLSRRQSPPHGVLRAEPSALPSLSPEEEESLETREEEVTDCMSDRRLALEDAKDSTFSYIPDCTPDGRFQKIQCYKSAGYCWCVHEDTGKNIPGTSVKNQIPNCNLLKATQPPMKGCPDDKKIVFLKDLIQFLYTKMKANNSAESPAITQSREEQVAYWSFNYFDKDKNKNLDRPEWKAFKDYIIPIKGLRKCGKKLPRYCDIDKDRKISKTEWLDCLNVQESQGTFYHSSPRTGKNNPLDILKDD